MKFGKWIATFFILSIFLFSVSAMASDHDVAATHDAGHSAVTEHKTAHEAATGEHGPLMSAPNLTDKKMQVMVVFLIFLVANIGGSLTPLGDPPLFLGFLHGVSF
jgi:hypothetical protein